MLRINSILAQGNQGDEQTEGNMRDSRKPDGSQKTQPRVCKVKVQITPPLRARMPQTLD
jgi:hypothetical protein